jgi:hypothetical protein
LPISDCRLPIADGVMIRSVSLDLAAANRQLAIGNRKLSIY